MRRAQRRLEEARFAAALPCAVALERVRVASGVDFGRARVRTGFGRSHLLEVVVYLPGGHGTRTEREAAEDVVRLLVGEEAFERWIGPVSSTPAVRGGPLTVVNENPEQHAALEIDTLPDTVRAAVAGLRQGLPGLRGSASHESARDDWLWFELEPGPAHDFAAQDDLVFCGTRLPEAKQCFLRGERFFSGRFCRSPALFTYLKYDSGEARAETRLAERACLEQALNRTLEDDQAWLVGLGLGLRYGYLDLVVGDVDWVSEKLFPALRAANIARNAWLLFCDSELESEREYLPLYPDTPAPFWG